MARIILQPTIIKERSRKKKIISNITACNLGTSLKGAENTFWPRVPFKIVDGLSVSLLHSPSPHGLVGPAHGLKEINFPYPENRKAIQLRTQSCKSYFPLSSTWSKFHYSGSQYDACFSV